MVGAPDCSARMTQVMRDRVLGLVLVLFALALTFILIPNGVVVPRSVRGTTMSPALWPYIVSGLLLVLGLAIALWTFTAAAVAKRDADRPEAWLDAPPDFIVSSPATARYTRVAFAILFLFVYYGMVRFAGIPVASAIAIPVLSLLYGERRYLLVIVLAITVPGTLYLFFDRVANIPIPLGILDF